MAFKLTFVALCFSLGSLKGVKVELGDKTTVSRFKAKLRPMHGHIGWRLLSWRVLTMCELGLAAWFLDMC